MTTVQANQQGEFRKFPLWMRHPNERPAVLCDEREIVDGRERWVNKPPGQARKFPPCMAIDAQQEEYFAAQGYVPIAGDPAAYIKATVAVTPPGYVHHEYPRLLPDGTLDLGPDAPAPPDNFYPYYVRMDGYAPTLVQDVEEHQALLQQRGIEPPPAPDPDAEIAELERQLAALRARKVEHLTPVAAAADPAVTDPTAQEDAAEEDAEAPGPVEPTAEPATEQPDAAVEDAPVPSPETEAAAAALGLPHDTAHKHRRK